MVFQVESFNVTLNEGDTYMIYIILYVYHTHNIGNYFYSLFYYKNYIILYFIITQPLRSVKHVTAGRQLVTPDLYDLMREREREGESFGTSKFIR